MGKVSIDRGALTEFARSSQVLRAVEEEFGDPILTDAQAKAPVKTGALRRSGYSRVEGDHVEVGFTADHAVYVELGTQNMHARPFLRPAAFRNRGTHKA